MPPPLSTCLLWLLALHLGSRSATQVTGDFRLGDIRHCYADASRSREVLGFVPAVDLERGIRGFCEWVLTQPIEVDRSGEAQKELSELGLGKAND